MADGSSFLAWQWPAAAPSLAPTPQPGSPRCVKLLIPVCVLHGTAQSGTTQQWHLQGSARKRTQGCLARARARRTGARGCTSAELPTCGRASTGSLSRRRPCPRAWAGWGHVWTRGCPPAVPPSSGPASAPSPAAASLLWLPPLQGSARKRTQGCLARARARRTGARGCTSAERPTCGRASTGSLSHRRPCPRAWAGCAHVWTRGCASCCAALIRASQRALAGGGAFSGSHPSARQPRVRQATYPS